MVTFSSPDYLTFLEPSFCSSPVNFLLWSPCEFLGSPTSLQVKHECSVLGHTLASTVSCLSLRACAPPQWGHRFAHWQGCVISPSLLHLWLSWAVTSGPSQSMKAEATCLNGPARGVAATGQAVGLALRGYLAFKRLCRLGLEPQSAVQEAASLLSLSRHHCQ